MLKVNLIFLATILLGSCGFFDSDDKMNLTIYAAQGDLEKVSVYISKVDNLNFVSLKGDSPLNAAVYNGHLEIVKLLMESGVSCNYKDDAGKTALAVALEQKKINAVTYLKSYGTCK